MKILTLLRGAGKLLVAYLVIFVLIVASIGLNEVTGAWGVAALLVVACWFAGGQRRKAPPVEATFDDAFDEPDAAHVVQLTPRVTADAPRPQPAAQAIR